MKRIITVLILFLIIFSSTRAFARQDFEVTGGLIYTIFDFEDLNKVIKSYNQGFEFYNNKQARTEFMEDIEGALGFYATVLTKINSQSKLGLEYQSISPAKSSGNLYNLTTNTTDMSAELNLELNSLSAVGQYQINDLVFLNGGLGYYFGSLESKIKMMNQPQEISEIDLDGFGFKGGISLVYQFQYNLKLTGSANYRLLTLEGYEDLTAKGKELNANGLELQAGLTYLF